MNDESCIVKLPRGALASRQNAIPFRLKITALLNQSSSEKVKIDLSEVSVISGSFADECIGVIVKQFGFDTVMNRIRLINGNQNVVRSIAEAIRIRKAELNFS